ncbi:MAG TPA: hypothetical protein VG125_15885 [Pirellulales bacterium]|jgi:hypothetical protein|nr:hypothetical protein [Pirellulales bacterium]
MRIDIGVEWLLPVGPGPPVPVWQRDAIQLGIASLGASLAAWRLYW